MEPCVLLRAEECWQNDAAGARVCTEPGSWKPTRAPQTGR